MLVMSVICVKFLIPAMDVAYVKQIFSYKKINFAFVISALLPMKREKDIIYDTVCIYFFVYTRIY
jgi:hypothetical protein